MPEAFLGFHLDDEDLELLNEGDSDDEYTLTSGSSYASSEVSSVANSSVTESKDGDEETKKSKKKSKKKKKKKKKKRLVSVINPEYRKHEEKKIGRNAKNRPTSLKKVVNLKKDHKDEVILVFGAFGNIGSYAVRELNNNKNLTIFCFDVETQKSLRVEQKLKEEGCNFETVWGDLADESSVKDAIGRVNPDIIAQLGEIKPPRTYETPIYAQKVNVRGTKFVIEAAESLQRYKKKSVRIIFGSSYTVVGPMNSSKRVSLITEKTPNNPHDLYGHQKDEGEKMVTNYEGEWTILRFGAVLPLEFALRNHEAATSNLKSLEFAMSQPAHQRRHGCDVRDAGYAVSQACVCPGVQNKLFLIGGDKSWKTTATKLFDGIGKAAGFGGIPRKAHRKPDPESDDSWYFEEWMDTTESQFVLKFQRYTFNDYCNEVKTRHRDRSVLMMILRPFIELRMKRKSPFFNDNKKGILDSLPYSEWILQAYPNLPKNFFDIDLDEIDEELEQEIDGRNLDDQQVSKDLAEEEEEEEEEEEGKEQTSPPPPPPIPSQ